MSIEKQKEFYNKKWHVDRNTPIYLDEKSRFNSILHCLKVIDIPQKCKILEVGCGLGRLANKLSEFGEVTGIDISDETIEDNKKAYPNIRFISGDIIKSRTIIKKNYYNMAVSSEVIEHIPYSKQQKFIDSIHNSLGKGGYLIITTPNKEITDMLGIKGDQPVEDFLTIEDLKSLLSRDFDILAIYTTYFFATNKILGMIFQKFAPLYLHGIEPIMRGTRDGIYMVCLARKKYE